MQNEQDAAPRRVSAAGIIAPARKPAAPPTPTAAPVASGRTSAAGLTVPTSRPAARVAPTAPACEPPRTRREELALFDRLRALRDSLPPNRNDRAVALIAACIAGGVCVKDRIVSALVHLGCDNVHLSPLTRWLYGRSAGQTFHLV